MVQRRNRYFNPKLLSLTIVVLTLAAAGGIFTGQMSRMASTVSTSPQTPASSGLYFDHLVVIMMEDQGISTICGGNPPPCNGSSTPYLSNLANSNGIGQQYLSLIPQSWPDYYGILGASVFGCPSNCYPAPGSIAAPNLVDRFQAAGVTWKAYMENQNINTGCDTGNQEPYEFGHNGFVAFQDITSNPARCDNIVLANPSSCGSVTDCSLINDLNSASAPNFMWLTPNDCNNMHATSNCSNGCTSDGSTTCLTDGDNYLTGLVPNILQSLTFRTERAALFVVFDEGNGYCPLNGSSENCLYDVWAGPVAKKGFSTATQYSHYSLTKTIEVNWNMPSLTNNDASATPMNEFFTSTPVVQLSTSFTYSPSSPQTGQQVALTASSSGGTQPYTYSWNFGDGTTGTGATVSHTYSTAGNYNVVLTAKDNGTVQQTATSQQTITVTTPPPPGLTASFIASLTNPTVGETVSFSGSASGGTAPYSYSWNFGDSSSGTGQIIGHAYQSPGSYSVVLTVTDAKGTKASATETLNVSAALSTSFTYSPSSPSVLQTVQFSSNTAGGTAPYSCSWDFGDGNTGTGATTSHSYTLPGTYTVTLSVTDANGLTATASQTITVGVSLTV